MCQSEFSVGWGNVQAMGSSLPPMLPHLQMPRQHIAAKRSPLSLLLNQAFEKITFSAVAGDRPVRLTFPPGKLGYFNEFPYFTLIFWSRQRLSGSSTDMSITRREFLAQTSSLSSLLVLSYAVPTWAAPGTEPRLSQRAHRGTTFEGNWQPQEIEGAMPPDLRGTLFRIGPGTKVAQGRALTHFFDGDGLVTALRLEDGQVFATSRFVQTEERAKEQAEGRMLYHEFGTAAGPIARGYKNSPNIHLMPLPEGLLALSEASHPTLLNPASLESAGSWNFAGSLPGNTTFTAHPKRDPKTGDIFSFGITRALSPELRVFKMASGQDRLQQIAAVNLGGFYPTHDMLMTENYLVFVVSPVKINLLKAASLHWPISEIIEYETDKPLRIFVAPKDGSAAVIEIESSPSGLSFHHINAFESDDGKTLTFHSIVQEDGSAYEIFKAWSAPNLPAPPKSWITKFKIDLSAKTVIVREKISDGGALDFPCLDPALISTDVRFVHLLESSGQDQDPLSFDRLACWDLHDGTSHRVQAAQGRTLGEPVFAPQGKANRENDGWLLMLGYDSARDQSFLEIRSPVGLEFISRVWLQRYVPLGFHGFFQRDS